MLLLKSLPSNQIFTICKTQLSFLFQSQLEKEAQDDLRYRQQLEQERRDHELALRLAQESNGQVEDSPPLIRKYVSAAILHHCNFIYKFFLQILFHNFKLNS